MVKIVRRGIEIEGKIDHARMYVGGPFRGKIMLVEDERDRFEDLFGRMWDWPGESDFVFYAHPKWQRGEWGIDGPSDEHCYPPPRPHEKWICNLVLQEDKCTWIATPIKFVQKGW